MRRRLLGLLSITSSAAWAQDALQPGPTWETVGLGALALLSTAMWAYLRGTGRRLREIEASVAAMERVLLRDYHTKGDIQQIVASAVAPLSSKLDELVRHTKRRMT